MRGAIAALQDHDVGLTLLARDLRYGPTGPAPARDRRQPAIRGRGAPPRQPGGARPRRRQGQPLGPDRRRRGRAHHRAGERPGRRPADRSRLAHLRRRGAAPSGFLRDGPVALDVTLERDSGSDAERPARPGPRQRRRRPPRPVARRPDRAARRARCPPRRRLLRPLARPAGRCGAVDAGDPASRRAPVRNGRARRDPPLEPHPRGRDRRGRHRHRPASAAAGLGPAPGRGAHPRAPDLRPLAGLLGGGPPCRIRCRRG